MTPWAPTSGGLDNIIGVDLLVVGNVVYVAALSRGTLRINRETAQVQSLGGGGVSAAALTYDPVTGPQGTLYVGGQAVSAGSTTRFPVVVALDAATGQPTGYRVGGASQGSQINALAVEPGLGGRLFAGGSFVTLSTGVVRRQGLAALDLTTGRPTDFAADISGPGQGLFEELALSPDGRFLYGYSNIVGGAALDLTEFNLVTGATRQFIPQGLTAASYGASGHVAEASLARRTEARGMPNPRVENAGSGVVVTDTRVCVGLSGVACYDRASASLHFYTPMVYVSAGGGNNGNLLYLPPGGPFGNPGGPDGALVLAAPVEEAPVGTVRAAFVAVDLATGDVIEDWDVGFDGPGALGFAGTMLDPDGTGGPALPTLYLGGEFESFGGPVGVRSDLLAADPATGAARPWAATVSGGTAPVLAMASHRTEDGRGVVYAGGTLFFAGGVRVETGVVAFDAVGGARRPYAARVTGVPRVMLLSERHGALFVGGSVGLSGTGHRNMAALVPAAPILPTAGEAGVAEATRTASLALAGPNPLRSRTALSLSLPEAQAVQASLYDVLGRRVAVLHAGPLPAGVSRINVDASTLPAGVYVARVVGASFTEALTLTIVR